MLRRTPCRLLARISCVRGEAASVAVGAACTAAASGKYGKVASVGANAKVVVVGDNGEVECEGAGSVAAAIGRSGLGKVGEGGLLVLIQYARDGEPLRAVSARAGQGGTIKPDT